MFTSQKTPVYTEKPRKTRKVITTKITTTPAFPVVDLKQKQITIPAVFKDTVRVKLLPWPFRELFCAERFVKLFSIFRFSIIILLELNLSFVFSWSCF